MNAAAAAIVTVICLSLGGEAFAAIGVGIFTVVLIIFGEVAPKTFGALYPEKLAIPAALVYQLLLKVLYPVVWVTNLLAHGVLRLAGISREKASATSLSREELRTVVAEASTVIPHRHQRHRTARSRAAEHPPARRSPYKLEICDSRSQTSATVGYPS